MTKIMFSKGNLKERKILATFVKEGEIIVDMFAGIGYFSLPIGKHSNVKKIYSIEINPNSFKSLIENIKINHLEEIIMPINGNCKEEVLKLSNSGIRADRVIMGVFPAPIDYIKEALTLTKEEGSVYHFEGVVEKEKHISLFNNFNEGLTELTNRQLSIENGRDNKKIAYGYEVILIAELIKDLSRKTEKANEDILSQFQIGMFESKRGYWKA